MSDKHSRSPVTAILMPMPDGRAGRLEKALAELGVRTIPPSQALYSKSEPDLIITQLPLSPEGPSDWWDRLKRLYQRPVLAVAEDRVGSGRLERVDGGPVLGGSFTSKELGDAIEETLAHPEPAWPAWHRSGVLLEQTLKSLKEVVFILDAETIRIIQVNPAVEEMLGYRPDELIGGDTSKLHASAESLADFRRRLERALDEKGYLYLANFQMKRKDGRIIPTEHTVTLIHSQDGRRAAYVSVVRDLTERLRAENALADSENKFKAFFDHTDDALLLSSPDDKIMAVNPAAVRLLGWTEAELLSGGRSLFMDENDERIRTAVETRRKTGRFEGEVRLRRKDGSYFTAEVTSIVFTDRSGGRKSSVVIRDVTERRRAEQRLRFQSQLLDSVRESVVATDLDGAITYWGKGAESLYGYRAEEALGRPVTMIVDPEQRCSEEERMAQVRETGHWQGQYQQVRKDGSRFLAEAAISMVHDHHGRPVGLIGIDRDVTEEERAKESLRENEERYRVLTENVADGVALIESGRILLANSAFTAMFGLPSDRPPADSFVTSLLPPALARVLCDPSGTGENAAEKMVQAPWTRADGLDAWIEVRANPIQWRGRPIILATFRDVTESKQREIAMTEEAESLRRENIQLRSTLRDRYRFQNIVGKSDAMRDVYEMIVKAADADTNVIITGESGTGKELAAKAIHDLSRRAKHRFVPVNCGAIPETLMESEFFGRVKGAFTGAHADAEGYLKLADQGSLFLDEVGELTLNMQAKLLRVLEGGLYTPVGGGVEKKADFRTIAASNRNLGDMVQSGAMREDFYYRIHIVVIHLPPLRERKEDIPLLVDHFIRRHPDGRQKSPPPRMMETLYEHDWPGNIRELQNVIHRWLTVGRLDFFSSVPSRNKGLGTEAAAGGGGDYHLKRSVEAYERRLIVSCLRETGWRRGAAASILGVDRKTLFRKMRKYGVEVPRMWGENDTY